MNAKPTSLEKITGVGDKAAEQIPANILKYYMDVGGQIRDARLAKNLNQDELADEAGISKVQLSRIENNKHIPSKQTLQKLSALIGIPYATLLFQAGYNNKHGETTLFTRNGEALDAMDIASSIYRADSELLNFFKDFDEKIGTNENVEVLKILLSNMRKEAETIEESDAENRDSAFLTSFSALKQFIKSTLSPVSN